MRYFWIPLLLFGCASQSNWHYVTIQTPDRETSSANLAYHAQDTYNELDIQLTQIDKTLTISFGTHFHPIPPYLEDPKKALIQLKTKNGVLEYVGIRLEGGQKVLLSPHDLQNFLSALPNASEVMIAEYRTRLDFDEYKKAFLKLRG